MPNAPTTNQEQLLSHLKTIFTEKTHVNAKKGANLKFPDSGAYAELDTWVPTHNICFEFQDSYHYATTWYSHKPQQKVTQLDDAKRAVVHRQGITLVIVPCWWDGEIDSLVATIDFYRPDLFADCQTKPIQLNPPSGYFQATELPLVGELMLASFPTDDVFHTSFPTNSWWIGEKYDGIRYFWHFPSRELYFRSGRILSLATPFANRLPSMCIDGEFWFGRGMFVHTHMLSKNSTDLVLWDLLRMISFDVPLHDESLSYEKRFQHLLAGIRDSHPFVAVVARILCVDKSHLERTAKDIISDGGEGVILQRLNSTYVRGRTPSLLKLKTAQGDREAIVVDINEDKSVKLKLPDGTEFEVANEDVHINLPVKGEIVSFSYESMARRSAPVNPIIYRVRVDLTWDDVIASQFTQNEFSRALENSQEGFTSKAAGFWDQNNMRGFLMELAKRRKLNPYNPETWRRITREDIKNSKGNTVLQKQNGYANALQNLFPEVSYDGNFSSPSWGDISNRRKFFEAYARANKFDPLVPDNWYKQSRKNILSFSGAHSVLYYHQDSVPKALVDLFPNIGLDSSRFYAQWHIASSRRKFFEYFAKKKGFSYNNPESWYAQSQDEILLTKGAHKVLAYHNGSVAKALIDLFPNIGLKLIKFWQWHAKGFFVAYAEEKGFDPLVAETWYSQTYEQLMTRKGAWTVMSYHRNMATTLMKTFPSIGLVVSKLKLLAAPPRQDLAIEMGNRRKFFENYAAHFSFNPLVAKNWYLQSRERIINFKGAYNTVLQHYPKISDAIADVFPDIGFEKEKFGNTTLWHKTEHRKKFFENYARENGFDPHVPENWHTQSKEKLMSRKGTKAVISYHGNRISNALVELFPNIGLNTALLNSKELKRFAGSKIVL